MFPCRAGPVCPAVGGAVPVGRRHTWVPPYREICKTCVGAAALPRPTMNAAFSQKCHSEERSDVGIRIPLTAAYHAEGVRIATPACGLVRNDRFFDKRYGAFRRRGEGTPPYAWVEGAVRGRRRGVGKIGESPPAADEASRFRGSAPIGGHDSGRESAGTTVGSRRPLRMRCDVQQGGTMWGAN